MRTTGSIASMLIVALAASGVSVLAQGYGKCHRGQQVASTQPAGSPVDGGRGQCQRSRGGQRADSPRCAGLQADRPGRGQGGQGRGAMRGQSAAGTQPAEAGAGQSLGQGAKQQLRARDGSCGKQCAAPMNDAEHERIRMLVTNHQDIRRTVENLPNGVKTTTTTARTDLLTPLRQHVRDMTARLSEGRAVRLWDPVFADVFAHAKEISVSEQEIDNGIVVVETSENAEVVPMIQAHARQVSQFAESGPEAAAPPWAGRRR